MPTLVSVPTVDNVNATIASHYKEIEIDFGSVGTDLLEVIVSDANITSSSKIILTQSMNQPTGKDQDEATMDDLIFRALPASGQFTLQAQSLTGPIHDKLKIFYLYG